ncbi:L-type lectin-domain containing receptor kinase IX.1-like [Mercurialis annua]|uniref:L-type lectin-domain containing receptor kinase IX.1-like n=1 Tax=Mercurialis annua TaxID=3986 RepID=UPI00215FAA81|nr:L-type lectin-domain containing receptor kinase IX.1-like [Mercurialis annua]
MFIFSNSPHCSSVITIIFLFLAISNAFELSFRFTTIGLNDSDIILEGDAFLSDSGIQLNPNEVWKQGHATYASPMHLWDKASGALADFTTNFSFSINAQNNASHADGFAFFIAPQRYRIPDQPSGSGIGLASYDMVLNSTNNPFVAVEFDTFYNNPFDFYNEDHVGIDVYSLLSSTSTRWYSSVMDGRRMDAGISYNSDKQNLSVTFTGIKPGNVTVEQHLYHEIDLRKYLSEWVVFGFSASTGTKSEFHTIHSWSFSSILQEHVNITSSVKDGGILVKGSWLWVLISACGLVLLGGSSFSIWFFWYKKRIGGQQDSLFHVRNEFEMVNGAKRFSLHVLAAATNNFDVKDKLGEGGFGSVFKGYLKDRKINVAVKRVSSGSLQGASEYAAEVIIISQLRQRNLVQLIGWCHEKDDLLLVYEYMPNGSLDFHLFCCENLLNWDKRDKIARGLASALDYLHQGWRRCVLHRDIKPSNVMLDSEFNPMLGDFGLARLVDHQDNRSQTLPGGSHGYIAPECLETGKSSKESDVFSFGVVALEIACGNKPFMQIGEDGRQVHIVKWVWEFYANGKTLNAADKKLDGHFIPEQMERLMIVGLWCAQPDSSARPSIREAINVLNFEAPLPLISLKVRELTAYNLCSSQV